MQSKHFFSSNNDILDGIEFIQTLKNLVNTARNMIDYYHGQWYSQALTLAAEIKVDVSLPRTCSRDVPASDASEYYKHTLTIPVLDHRNSDLEARFDVSSVNAIYGISIIPSKMIPLINKTGIISWKQTFMKFSNFYEEDFPNALALDGELELWQTY